MLAKGQRLWRPVAFLLIRLRQDENGPLQGLHNGLNEPSCENERITELEGALDW